MDRPLNACASKLSQKWPQRLDNMFVRNPITGHYAVTVLQIEVVVGERLTKEISEFATGFVQNDFGSARVPLFGAR